MIGSRQVDWWATHRFIAEMAKHADQLPVAGTPGWCAMPDTDPRKLLALAVAGQHHVLRVETAQQAQADAATAISQAADWSAISREMRRRQGFRSAHPWTRRKGAADA